MIEGIIAMVIALGRIKKGLIVGFIALMAVSWAPTDSRAQSDTFNDDKIKSVFIYNLTHFTSWPDASVPQSTPSFSICLLGDDLFDNVLEKVVESESVSGAPIVVKRSDKLDALNIGQCQMLFVAQAFEKELAEVLARTRGKPVLVIGDTPGFAENGGMVNLVRSRGRLRIEINTHQVAAAGLKLNAKLLQLAHIVK